MNRLYLSVGSFLSLVTRCQ